jgi:TPR repeat protein
MRVKKHRLSTDPYAAMNRGDVRKAFQLFRSQAYAGDASAWLNLGYLFDLGVGTRRNRRQAMSCYLRAYRSGSGAAASNIATIYRDEGRPRLQFQWYRRAAALRDGDAAVEVAKHYRSGVGVRRDPVLAKKYLQRALRTKYISRSARAEARILLGSAGRSGR